MNILILFLLGLATDILWVGLTKAVADRAAARATIMSVSLEGFKLATAWIVITNDSLASAASFLVGCAIGTYFSTRYK